LTRTACSLLSDQRLLQTFERRCLDDAIFIVEILADLSQLSLFDILGALVFLR
jgi:hypothetical protein